MTLLLDWISREGQIVFAWWLWINAGGSSSFPALSALAGRTAGQGIYTWRAL